jgi:hypothetical protein
MKKLTGTTSNVEDRRSPYGTIPNRHGPRPPKPPNLRNTGPLANPAYPAANETIGKPGSRIDPPYFFREPKDRSDMFPANKVPRQKGRTGRG